MMTDYVLNSQADSIRLILFCLPYHFRPIMLRCTCIDILSRFEEEGHFLFCSIIRLDYLNI